MRIVRAVPATVVFKVTKLPAVPDRLKLVTLTLPIVAFTEIVQGDTVLDKVVIVGAVPLPEPNINCPVPPIVTAGSVPLPPLFTKAVPEVVNTMVLPVKLKVVPVREPTNPVVLEPPKMVTVLFVNVNVLVFELL